MDQDKTYKEEELRDERLAVQARRGDTAAFALLVKRYEQPLFRYLRRMLGNTPDAEDMFQETFLRVHQHLGRYRDNAPFRPWLYRIATNLCRDRLRYRRRHPMLALDAPPRGGPRCAALGRTPARGRTRPR